MSSAGGTQPAWGPDGKELFFRCALDISRLDALEELILEPRTGKHDIRPRLCADDSILVSSDVCSEM